MNTIHAHKITSERQLPFDVEEYSKFKFGCKKCARKFGQQLSAQLRTALVREYFHQKVSIPQIVVLSSPYAHIPTATAAMKDYLVRDLNNWLAEVESPVVQETKIHRTITYTEDYGMLNAEQRMKLIGGDAFHVDGDYLLGKLCLFIDDIKITGSHEQVIRRMISSLPQPQRFTSWFLYYAVLDSSVGIHPNIENRLNYAYVSNLERLSKIVNSDDFQLNTRVVKYILNSQFAECQNFLKYQGLRFLESLYHAAIGNGYHLETKYKHNLDYLKHLIWTGV